MLEIDGASNTGVDNIRELNEAVRYRPASSRFKIYIIDEVHMLSTAAFNALLKTLEEPPEHVKFIFATTEVHKLPPTVVSRCQRYDFKRIPMPELLARLRQIVVDEKIEASRRGALRPRARGRRQHARRAVAARSGDRLRRARRSARARCARRSASPTARCSIA